MAVERKVRIGVSFDRRLVDALDEHVQALKELGVDRSEAVNAILSGFLEDSDTTEAVWEAVSRRRMKRREG
jgi:metal-responsive CopG/Arc/MetJ family transcriptional regulator